MTAGQREPSAGRPEPGRPEPGNPEPRNTEPKPEPEPGPTPMRGVWVAVAIIGGAALVFFVLALTSGALG